MSIVLENLTKRYGSQTVVKQVSLEIADGELFVLLGASGSGKSTILRMIAGLSACDEGRVLVKGRDVTHLAPQPRGTGFVFQNYSIFRHMTVAENIQFGLRIRKVPSAQRAKRCEELLDMVELNGLGDRYASQISGGQQQRVALARALAYEPSVLLLDEPLGALDVKIRSQLRRSLKEIQRRLKLTTLLVTHDQEEAYELGDRIGVMERGALLEVGAPEGLYVRPKTLYVAGFLGAGTVLAGRVANGEARFGPITLPIPEELPHEEGASVELLFRPEQVELSATEPEPGSPVLGKGSVVERTFSGAMRRLRLRLPRLSGTRQVAPALPFGEECLVVDTIASAHKAAPAGEVWVQLREWTILEQAPPRLLVVDSGAASRASLNVASALARAMRAATSVFGLAQESRSEELRGTLARRAEEAGLLDFEVQTGSGALSQQIAAQCANALFELVIVPRELRHAKPELHRAVIDFLERADLPVIVAAGEKDPRFLRVLICTRAGAPGKSDIRIGGRLARHLGARVTLFHIMRPGTEVRPLVRRHLEHASATLSALEVPTEILTRADSNPAEAILRETGEHDLLVIGGHGPQAKSLFGRDDIALQVLTRAHCPVLVVPADV
jgi:ABC-type Fe3+/spermidine/putrescine transport system ATPase subunit